METIVRRTRRARGIAPVANRPPRSGDGAWTTTAVARCAHGDLQLLCAVELKFWSRSSTRVSQRHARPAKPPVRARRAQTGRWGHFARGCVCVEGVLSTIDPEVRTSMHDLCSRTRARVSIAPTCGFARGTYDTREADSVRARERKAAL